MNEKPPLSRREREIMDAVYRLGAATVAEIRVQLAAPPSYSAVRALLKILETKGHLDHFEEGPRYIYRPRIPREQASRSAMNRLVTTFFEGSPGRAAATLIDMARADLTAEEWERLSRLIEEARKEGR